MYIVPGVSQARLSTGAGGLGLSSAERGKCRFHWDHGWDLTGRSADLTGSLRARVKTGLPESRIVNGLERTLREINDTWGVSKRKDGRHRPGMLDRVGVGSGHTEGRLSKVLRNPHARGARRKDHTPVPGLPKTINKEAG